MWLLLESTFGLDRQLGGHDCGLCRFDVDVMCFEVFTILAALQTQFSLCCKWLGMQSWHGDKTMNQPRLKFRSRVQV